MIQHIVMWNFKDELSNDERSNAGATIKEKLESLNGKIHGLIEAKVIINEVDSSNRDIALFTSFETHDDLKNYQVNPLHVEAASYVRNMTCNRICFDY